VLFRIDITIIDSFSEVKLIITSATGQEIEFIAKKAFIAITFGKKAQKTNDELASEIFNELNERQNHYSLVQEG
jgi:hypothetical protein